MLLFVHVMFACGCEIQSKLLMLLYMFVVHMFKQPTQMIHQKKKTQIYVFVQSVKYVPQSSVQTDLDFIYTNVILHTTIATCLEKLEINILF